MFAFEFALSLLFISSASPAFVQASTLTAPLELTPIATATKIRPRLALTPASLPTGDFGACSTVILLTTTVGPSIITLSEPATVYVTFKSFIGESTIAAQGAAGSSFPEEAIPCPNCIKTTTEVTRHGTSSAAHHVLEAREPFPLTGNSTACRTTTVLIPITLPGIIFRPTVTITQIVTLPPKKLTSTDSLGSTSKKIVDTPSSKTPQTLTAQTALPTPQIATTLTGTDLLHTDAPAEPATNVVESSTPRSNPASTVTGAASASRLRHIPAVNSISPVTTGWPKERPPPENLISTSDTTLPVITTGQELVIAPTDSVSSGKAASPATSIRLFSNPGSLPPPAPVIATIGNSPITLNPEASSIVFTPSTGGFPVTILPGSAAQTLPGGTIISLSPSTPTSDSKSAAAAPPVLIISSIGASTAQSITFPNAPLLGPPTPTPAPGQMYIPIRVPGNPPSILVGDGASAIITLTPGAPAATASGGIPISLGTDGSILVVGSSTITIAATATGLGGYLYGGLGVGPASGASASGSGSGSGSMTITTSMGMGLRMKTGIFTSTIPASRRGNGTSSAAPTSTSVLQSNGACRSLATWARTMGWLPALLSAVFVLR